MPGPTNDSPIGDVLTVTPHDANNLREVESVAYATRAIYVGVSGNVTIVTADGQTVLMVNLVSGVWHPIRAMKIKSSGTAATSILAGF